MGREWHLDTMSGYSASWKLELNISKTKMMAFRKAGHLRRKNLVFPYNKSRVGNCYRVTCLVIKFSAMVSFSAMQQMLADQARKALFRLYQYRNNFINRSTTLSASLSDS